MGLSNSQYNAIMRTYNEKQIQNKHNQDLRIHEIYQKIPMIRELESSIGTKAVACAKRLLSGDTAAQKELKDEIEDLKEQRQILLSVEGYPKDYMEMHYTCKDCQDTGYVNGKKCRCFKQMEISLLYEQSNLEKVVEKENFSVYSDDFYDHNRIYPELGMTLFEYMKQVKRMCYEYINHFAQKKGNILFQGGTGVGKTFLTNCIAKELIDRYYSVIYLSATELFRIFAEYTFDRNDEEEQRDRYRHILDCDLLIIDDLGTEMNNSFVSSQFFFCVNERLLRKKGTIISTNMDMARIRDEYTDRVASRIISEYLITPLYGDDIRTKIR